MERLSGRVAVITGAASGIGLASAKRLASEGAHVVVADMNVDAGEALAKELDGLFVRVDVTSADDNDALDEVCLFIATRFRAGRAGPVRAAARLQIGDQGRR